ncbi:MAG: hypothetical protein HY673_27145 [Chloroflexi bacterium]|nr:hypothetical protein [Chloroflexota bacterium]
MAASPEEYFERIVEFLGKGISPLAEFDGEPSVEMLGDQLGKLEAKVVFADGSKLEVVLAVDFTGDYPEWTHYSFHYMDDGGRCRLRYDNSRHYPGLPHFPHHRHEGPSEQVYPTSSPSVRRIGEEIRKFLSA